MKILTVKEAVSVVNQGEKLEGVVIDKDSIKQVNVRDAMILSQGGIVIPEENLYYEDDEIEYDEEIDSLIIGKEITHLTWEEKAKKFEGTNEMNVTIDLNTDEEDVNEWIISNRVRITSILKPIIKGLFKAEKELNKNSPNTAPPPTG